MIFKKPEDAGKLSVKISSIFNAGFVDQFGRGKLPACVAALGKQNCVTIFIPKLVAKPMAKLMLTVPFSALLQRGRVFKSAAVIIIKDPTLKLWVGALLKGSKNAPNACPATIPEKNPVATKDFLEGRSAFALTVWGRVFLGIIFIVQEIYYE